MIRKAIFAVVIIAVVASAAYYMGWLSGEGEDVFEDTRDVVIDKGEDAVDKARDAMD